MPRNARTVLCAALTCALLLLSAPFVRAQDAPKFEETECLIEIPEGMVVRCGYLNVPERRTQTTSQGQRAVKTLRLYVAIIKAANPTLTPIVYLEGGPGGSAVMGIDGWEDSPLLDNRDFILLDQRGAGFSEPSLNCVEYDEDLEQMEAVQACHDRLIREGVDLGAYNSAENAADVADLRRALGYAEWDLLGVSYGTRLALTVLRDHSEGVRSVIIDGVYPPHVNLIEEIGPNTVAIFDHLFNACTSDSACNAAFPDLRTTFYRVLETLHVTPATLEYTDPETGESGERTIDDGDFVDMLFQALYVPDFIPLLPKAIHQAGEDDYSTVVELLDEGLTFGRLDHEETADDDSEGMYLSVECQDEVPFSDKTQALNKLADAPKAIQGKLIDDTTRTYEECAVWGVPKAAAIENEPVRSAVPTLIFNGEFDPITPPKYGAEAAKYLTTRYEFTFPAMGHGATGSSECADSIALAFLANPHQPPDSACLEAMEPVSFVTE